MATHIQKYSATVVGTTTVVVGYITEGREYLGDGSYGTGTDYVISVTDKSMPGGDYGTFKVIPESIKAITPKSDVMPSLANGAKVLKLLKEFRDSLTDEERQDMFGSH